MRHSVTSFVDRSLPVARFPDAEDRRRGRVLITGSMVLTFVCLLVFVNTALSPSSRLVNYIGVGGLLLTFGAVPTVVRLTGNVRRAGLWAVGGATLLLAALVSSGGMRAPALSWIVFMPLLAHFFVSRVFALVILLVAVATVSITYGLTLSGHDFPISYRGDQLAHLRWLSAIIFAVTCAAVASLYDDARQRARRLQQEVNERLRETNDTLARARDQAEAASRAKSTFLATVSHELRTPLHGVLAMTGALQGQTLSASGREQVGIADRAARTLNELIEDLLHLSEIEAGAMRLRPQAWRLRETVADLAQIYGAQASEKGLRLVVEVDDEVPTAVHADPLRVQQVISNLLGNAIKFTEQGEVCLAITWRRRPDADEPQADAAVPATEVVIAVRDTGPGIAVELREAIFDPFIRVDSSPTRRHGGTGLGLAISRKLVEHMGGTITLTSDVGVGSRFVVALPCAAVAAPTSALSTTRAPPTMNTRGRVLVADDSVICQEVLRQLLTPLGFDVDVVSDGQEALDQLEVARYDVVLMDCEMPLLDGISAVRLLRERERGGGGRRVPVIAVTAHGLVEHREVCIEAGMDDLLSKPFRLAELEEVIGRWIGLADEPEV